MNAQPQHIYVVDDEASARELVGDYLTLHGFTVTLCEGGSRLRKELARKIPDLIVLDLNMPEEDGLSIIRFLKDHCPVPVIMLTASASPIDRVVGLELGADDYMAKPCELRELLARTRSLLRRLKFSPARHTDRRLAAIVSFDFVGFSRFIQDNESETLAALDRIFGEVITPSLLRHRGILFKMLGDGALVEFASVVDAVEWSMWLQTQMRELGHAYLSNGRIVFRLGIAVGDVVLNHNDRAGEGVTLAVRVQEVAEPGAIAMSDQAFALVRGKTNAQFADGGERRLKNIAAPMNIYTWSPGAAPKGA
jgi:class 3 adenylate cyclase